MKNSHFFNVAFSLLVLMSFSGGVKADACPQGTITNPVGAGGQPQCVPGTNHQNWGGGNSSQGTHWSSRFGAVVYDPVTGAVGFSSDEKSKRKALKAAFALCKSKGGTACARNIEYSDQCVASVSGPSADGRSAFSSVSAVSESVATEVALKSCEEVAVGKCKVFYSACSYPEQT